ncbi:phosphate/phosphite/phosphonate ABC transporter substrate-binding protein [Roseomonas sp. HF4]|uniref:phosphate/phosphite/phosphonate ABC transporter substrate-binding protein n=1 Tax=Roseomonas sp. HF4 TaxID=2562313 RepID=UPI0010BFCEE2|nr:phosphate/phosphite/phosphonate ABC transporter substrate-binding protein [Roseomonas sp. HF4]
MILRRTALALPALALLPRGAGAETDWRTSLREVRYGMISVENERDAITRLQGLQGYMTRELRVPFRVFRGSDYAAVVEAMRSGHSELAYLGPASYGLARRVMGERVAPIFRYRDNAGLEGYHSVMIVKADSPVQRLEEMRGRTLAFSDPNSTSGFQVPGWFLRRQGMDPANFFTRTGFSGSHEQSVVAVINGTYDAAVVAYSNDARNTFQRMVEKGMIPANSVRVIWRSPLIPNSPIVIRTDLPAAFRRDVTAAFAAMPERDPEGFRQMSSNAQGLAPATHEDYLDIMAILEENAQRRRERRS